MTAGPDQGEQVLFIGADASSSRALVAVPKWSRLLGTRLQVQPVDVPVGASPEAYAGIVERLAGDSGAIGAIITGHKVGMFAAAKPRCTYVSPDADHLRECTVLAVGPGGLIAHATDVRSIGAEVDRIWPPSAAPMACLGAGGSGAALVLFLTRRRPAPRTLMVCESDPGRADALRSIFPQQSLPAGVELQVMTGASVWDEVVSAMPPGSLIVNATGLGKTDRLSPISPGARLPHHSVLWDLNYRGPLPFLALAEAQAAAQRLRVHDGWRLFSLGWLEALTALLGQRPPPSAEDGFVRVAEEVGR